MLARIRKSMEQKDQGFTLIELLVVMIIIGILAAIAIPVFLNQRIKARDSAAKADATTIGKELAGYYVDGTLDATVTGSAKAWTAVNSSATLVSGTISSGDWARGKGTASNQSWCVEVATADKHVWKYDWKTGLTAGTDLTAAPDATWVAGTACTPTP